MSFVVISSYDLALAANFSIRRRFGTFAWVESARFARRSSRTDRHRFLAR